MTKPALSQQQIEQQLNDLNSGPQDDWTVESGKLHREFTFKNFVEAFGFMTRVAMRADKMNHHPEWSNVYRTVDVNLVTHHANGITELDFKLADTMNKLAQS